MASTLIVYGSTTGNTESVSETLESCFKDAGHTVKTIDASGAKATGLCDGYDIILFGSSTWGQDTIEFQDDFGVLFDDFDKINAEGKKVAVFGCGDSGYEYFCGAVDEIEKKLKEMNANVLVDSLKIDGDVDDDEVKAWGKDVLSAI